MMLAAAWGWDGGVGGWGAEGCPGEMMTMVDQGRPWSPRYLMVDHGSSWLTVKYRGDDHGQVVCDHGRPWSTMVDHGQSRSTMVNHGRPWSIVDQITYDHGRPWSITVDRGQSRSTMVKSHDHVFSIYYR